jgi:hypothetical protein
MRNFTVGEMLSVTEPWVQPGHPERVLLDNVAATAALMRFIVQLHGELIGSQSGVDAARVAGLTGELGLLDGRHDILAKAVSGVLAAYRLYHQGGPLGALLDALDQALFPDGLQIVRASYRDSAGRATLRATLLTGEQSALLSSIPVQGGTLLDWINEWNQVAERIGALSNERDTPASAAAERPVSNEVRNRWIRTVRTVLDVLTLEAQERPELQRIINRVAQIEAVVDRRRRASRGDAPGDADGQPTDDIDDGLADEPGNEPAPSA